MSTQQPLTFVETIDLEGTKVRYIVRRSRKARNMRITVTSYDGVVVTLPARLPRYLNPEEFLREKSSWVLKHLEQIGYSPDTTPELTSGSIVTVRGVEYELAIEYGMVKKPRLRFTSEPAVARLSLPEYHSDSPKSVLQNLLRHMARTVLHRETERQAERIGVRYNRVIVRDQKTKWGSCSRKGNISFNWRLILFPPKILRYIVIHELCHLRHFDHSPRFWRLVERHAPDYRDSVEWLREQGLRTDSFIR